MQPPNSVVDSLIARQVDKQKGEEIKIEREEDYRAALNRIFSMNEGKLLAHYMLKFSGWFIDADQINPAALIEQKGRQAFYKKLIRPYLDKRIRMELENYDLPKSTFKPTKDLQKPRSRR